MRLLATWAATSDMLIELPDPVILRDEALNLGAGLRQIRRSRGLTQQAFAEMCQLPTSALSVIESGKRQPSVKHLDALLNVLGYRLLVVHPKVPTASVVSADLSRFANKDKSIEAVAIVGRFIRGLTKAGTTLAMVLCETPPLTNGRPTRWDCLLAACIVHIFEPKKPPLPDWVGTDTLFLTREWSPLGQRPTIELRTNTPARLLERGILLTLKQLAHSVVINDSSQTPQMVPDAN